MKQEMMASAGRYA